MQQPRQNGPHQKLRLSVNLPLSRTCGRTEYCCVRLLLTEAFHTLVCMINLWFELTWKGFPNHRIEQAIKALFNVLVIGTVNCSVVMALCDFCLFNFFPRFKFFENFKEITAKRMKIKRFTLQHFLVT
jgi:hypothetical protein